VSDDLELEKEKEKETNRGWFKNPYISNKSIANS